MVPNKIKKLWSEGKPVINGWLSTSSPFVAEIMAAQGYDSLTVDCQHGLVAYEAATTMLQAMRASGVVPMVRVPWLDPGDIMKALDAGSYGIICPMVNSRAEAQRLVSWMRYPPDGVRSFGPTRAVFAAGADYGQHANDEVLALAMIETADAMTNLDEIVTTPGLDGVYIGPADLALGLTGRKYPTGFDRQEPELVEAIQHVLKKAKAAGIRAGLHCGTPAYAAKAIGWGFDLVTLSNDVRLLAGAANQSVTDVRKLLGDAPVKVKEKPSSGY
jgi:4-hydroxy-2-oxoheptanedioate aldolase